MQNRRRALEDLTAHRLVLRAKQGKGQADTWTLTKWASERLAATDVEMSEGGYFFYSLYRRRQIGNGTRGRGMTLQKVRSQISAIALLEPEAAASLGLGATFFREHVALDLA